MRLARALGFVLLLGGLSLLTLAVVGHWTPIGEYPSVTPPSDWEDRFDPDLPPLTRDLEALYKAAEAAAPKP
ncbi:MAG: hypothetical protein K8I02_04290, partial [Candidatus Methylomirabilis sp.]|nr:hypothetical protein [Deltaproteobacteria bacterium]